MPELDYEMENDQNDHHIAGDGAHFYPDNNFADFEGHEFLSRHIHP
jgi:hypothetical protein